MKSGQTGNVVQNSPDLFVKELDEDFRQYVRFMRLEDDNLQADYAIFVKSQGSLCSFTVSTILYAAYRISVISFDLKDFPFHSISWWLSISSIITFMIALLVALGIIYLKSSHDDTTTCTWVRKGQLLFSILMSLELGYCMMTRIYSRDQYSFTTSSFWSHDRTQMSQHLPEDTLIIMMLSPIMISAVLRKVPFACIICCWLLIILEIVAGIIYTHSYESISSLSIYFPISLLLIYENQRQFLSTFFLMRRIQSAASARDQQMSAFASEYRGLMGNMSHDLKTPIAGISSAMECVEHISRDILNQSKTHVLPNDQIHTLSNNLLDIVQDIKGITSFMLMSINRCIDYTKVSKGLTLTPKQETISIYETLDLPLHVMKSMQSRIKIILSPISQIVSEYIITDKQWLQENLLCLLSNAVKYSTEGEVLIKITLSTINYLPMNKSGRRMNSKYLPPSLANTSRFMEFHESRDVYDLSNSPKYSNYSSKSSNYNRDIKNMTLNKNTYINANTSTTATPMNTSSQSTTMNNNALTSSTHPTTTTTTTTTMLRKSQVHFNMNIMPMSSTSNSSKSGASNTSGNHSVSYNTQKSSQGITPAPFRKRKSIFNTSVKNLFDPSTYLPSTTHHSHTSNTALNATTTMNAITKEANNDTVHMTTHSITNHTTMNHYQHQNHSNNSTKHHSGTSTTSGTNTHHFLNHTNNDAHTHTHTQNPSSSSSSKSSTFSNSSKLPFTFNRILPEPLQYNIQLVPPHTHISSSSSCSSSAASTSSSSSVLKQHQLNINHINHINNQNKRNDADEEKEESVSINFSSSAAGMSTASNIDLYLLFEIEDHGIGIDDDIMSKLFTPFRQAQRYAGGTGLGLFSLAKRVEALDGYYGVRHRHDGVQGSVFWFAIPYKPDEQAQLYLPSTNKHMKIKLDSPSKYNNQLQVHVHHSHQGSYTDDSSIYQDNDSCEITTSNCTTPLRHTSIPSDIEYTIADSTSHRVPIPIVSDSRIPTSYPSISPNADIILPTNNIKLINNLNVLLVDDSMPILKMTGLMLRKLGHQVTEAINGEIALMKLIESFHGSVDKRYDVVLMDIQMPIMDGLECTRRFRHFEDDYITKNTDSAYKKQHIIGCSANCDNDTHVEALSAGMNVFITKPLTIKTFMDTYSKITYEGNSIKISTSQHTQ